MRTIKKYYKTLNGFMNAVGYNCVSVGRTMEGYYQMRNGKYYLLSLDLPAREKLGEYFAELWSKPYRKRVVKAFKEQSGDYSYLLCFYIERYDGKTRIGNSLSGTAYDYCKRAWLKSII